MTDKKYPNLKPWKPGESGNPAGRRPGSKNISTIVRNLLSQRIDTRFPLNEQVTKMIGSENNTYADAVVISMALKATEGDVRAASWLVNQELKGETQNEESGLFNTSKLVIEIVKNNESALD